MAISFKHYYKSGSLIGTGAVKFRPYAVASPLPQLATPQNVTANGTTVSWDEVENAIEYELVVNNTSWGTYTPTVYNYTFDESTGVLTLLDVPYEQNGDTVTIS